MLSYILVLATLVNVSILCAGSNYSNLSTDSTVDLEAMAQDYVLEVKQLNIPDHPTACNPSLIR